MATYATQADFEAYVEGWTTEDAAALERLLQRAERDVDRLLSGVRGTGVGGLKLIPADLETWQAEALARAVCAQGEYAITMGDEFLVRDQYDEAQGPQFRQKGKLSRIGPKVWIELDGVGLLAGSGRYARTTLQQKA